MISSLDTWDFGCPHSDKNRRPFDSSIKEYIGADPCWGHTGYFIFELKDKTTGKKGIFKFKNIHTEYGTTEICASVATTDSGTCKTYYCNDCNPCGSLPSGLPEGFTGTCNDFPDNPYQDFPGVELPIEVSVDGKTWTKIYGLPFRCRKTGITLDISLPNYVYARFIRFRQPLDKGGKALAGYLDWVWFNIDSQLIQEEVNITDVGNYPVTLDASNCLENINGRNDYSMPTYTPSDCPPIGKYCFASCLHSTTWFAGFEKKWVVKKITGNFTTVPYRGDEEGFRCPTSASIEARNNRDTTILLQFSMDGVNWQTVELPAKRGATATFEYEFQNPVEIRYIRLAPKPRWWGNGGSTPECWLKNASLTLQSGVAGQPVADITQIQWWPDYPDKRIPPNTYTRWCVVKIKNIGNAAGTIYLKAYGALVGITDWELLGSTGYYFNAGQEMQLTLSGTTPSYGTLHTALVVFSEAETEPPLPPASQCP